MVNKLQSQLIIIFPTGTEIIDYAQNQNHKQSVTEAYQQGKPRRETRVRAKVSTLDTTYKSPFPPPHTGQKDPQSPQKLQSYNHRLCPKSKPTRRINPRKRGARAKPSTLDTAHKPPRHTHTHTYTHTDTHTHSLERVIPWLKRNHISHRNCNHRLCPKSKPQVKCH